MTIRITLYDLKAQHRGLVDQLCADLCRFLAGNRVGTGRYYPIPANLEPALSRTGTRLPVAETASQHILTLPIRASLTDSEQEQVFGLVQQFFARRG